MPDWLYGHHSEINADFLPKIASGVPVPLHLNLGKVKQKAVDLQRWVRYIHQLLLWVGSSRTGRPSRARKGLKEQEHESGRHDSGSGWNYDRSRGQSVAPSGGAASSGLDRDERSEYWSGWVQRSDW